MRELIRSGIDGLLVPPCEMEVLTAVIRRLVVDPDPQLRVDQAGRLRVLEKFDLSKEQHRIR